jgi:molybdate transport system substrate-binding protein
LFYAGAGTKNYISRRKDMKKLMSALAALVILANGAAFAGGDKDGGKGNPAEKPAELVVFAAASMTEAMNEIAGLYKTAAPHTTVVYNFDSSGTLKTQIQQGAPCDLFISAGQLQMNQLDLSADPSVNKDKLDFLLPGSRFNIVSNQVVMIVPFNSSKGISDFRDVLTSKVTLVALGNGDVPVGQYSKEIYTNLGIWEALEKSGKVTYGSNVKEVLAHVESGAVDCGIVYGTDAATSRGVAIAASAPASSHRPITYPAAIMKNTRNQKAAEDFAAFLKGGQAQAVFTRIGFARP